jgi:cell division protein FtsL
VSWRATVFWSLLAALVGFGLFHVKYRVQKLEDRLARINRDIVREQEQIHVLRAEWTYLNRPERIEQLAKKYLDLVAPKASQMSSIAQLPMRGNDTPIDPAAMQSSRQPAPKAPPAPARSPQPAPVTMMPTPVAAGQTNERRHSRSSSPDFGAGISSGFDGPVTLPEGGR